MIVLDTQYVSAVLKTVAIGLAIYLIYYYASVPYLRVQRRIFISIVIFAGCILIADSATRFRAVNIALASIGWLGLLVHLYLILGR
jgi:uncharacterized membrane-anchored protein